MKYAVPFVLVLSGCSTFNAFADGAQDIVNKTIAATGWLASRSQLAKTFPTRLLM